MKWSKQQLASKAILVLRWYLAFYMVSYGFSKLNGEQFGLYNAALLEKPLKEIDTFYLAWYLFSLSKPFNVVVGVLQIVAALLLVINRTAIVGALFVLPVLGQIFLVDVAFTTNQFGYALPVRLACMIFSAGTILYFHRVKLITVWHTLTQNLQQQVYPWWVYLLLPFAGFATDFVFAILTWPLKMLLNCI